MDVQYSSEEEEEDLNSAAANLANKQKKDLAKIDHSGVEYLPFRKAFYVEVPEIARMTQEEVAQYREVNFFVTSKYVSFYEEIF